MAPDFTIADVLAWARTKPADEPYSYIDSGNCALCHFLRETGRAAFPRVSPYLHADDSTAGWREHGAKARRPYPTALETPLATAETFGELADLLAQLEPSTPVTASEWLSVEAYLALQTVSA